MNKTGLKTGLVVSFAAFVISGRCSRSWDTRRGRVAS